MLALMVEQYTLTQANSKLSILLFSILGAQHNKFSIFNNQYMDLHYASLLKHKNIVPCIAHICKK